MSERSSTPKRVRFTRWIALSIAVVVGLGICTMRILDLRSAGRTETAEAIAALSLAVEGGPDAQTDARFDDAQDAAVEAARVSAAMMDPMAAFLLVLVEDVRDAADDAAPGPDADVFAWLDWLIAHDRLEEALAQAERARSEPGAEEERLTLYVTVIERMRSMREAERRVERAMRGER